LQAENARLKERLLALQLQLPLDREVTGLLRQLSELSAASGLQVVLWKPKEKTLHPGKEIYEIPVDIEVRGTYYRLADFFRKMNALERVMNISNLSIKEFTASPRKEPGRLQVSFTAVTYSPVSELEQIEIQKALKKGPENKKQ
jgi:Tfp pilus assembly protein PilO